MFCDEVYRQVEALGGPKVGTRPVAKKLGLSTSSVLNFYYVGRSRAQGTRAAKIAEAVKARLDAGDEPREAYESVARRFGVAPGTAAAFYARVYRARPKAQKQESKALEERLEALVAEHPRGVPQGLIEATALEFGLHYGTVLSALGRIGRVKGLEAIFAGRVRALQNELETARKENEHLRRELARALDERDRAKREAEELKSRLGQTLAGLKLILGTVA